MGASNQKRSKLTLFSDPSDHYSHRIRIVLAEKDVTVEIVDITSDNASDELPDVNPYLSLPTLVDRDLMLYEPAVIAEFLDERFPHPPMLPVYPVARAEIRQLIHRIEKDWCVHVNTLLKSDDNDQADRSREALTTSFLAVAPVFKDLDFFMSADLTLADCCIAPVLWRLPQLGIELKGQAFEPMRDYMRRIFSRAGFRASLTETERSIQQI